MKMAYRIVGMALTGAGLALSLTAVATADPGPGDRERGSGETIVCEGPGHDWAPRGTWAFALGEDGDPCEIGEVTSPRGSSSFQLAP